jgi:hypothetical protein
MEAARCTPASTLGRWRTGAISNQTYNRAYGLHLGGEPLNKRSQSAPPRIQEATWILAVRATYNAYRVSNPITIVQRPCDGCSRD